LYRIATVYGVSVDKVARLNRIEDPTRLKPGDMVFIPGATRQREVPTTPPQGPGPAREPRQETTPTQRKPSVVETARIEPRRASESAPPASTWMGGSPPRLIWPVNGPLTSRFGRRDGVPHDGIDIAAPRGTDIRCAADGRVIYSDDEIAGYGRMIIVRHAGSWATVYAHNDENLVERGEFVSQGQVIARVGDTGRASAPHLHFEVRFGKSPRDPLQYLPEISARGN
jgi:murein DD-endopeptidase MepM/ murein hydrolase activator NlpD